VQVESGAIVGSIDRATGKVAVGQLVTITSPRPITRPPAKVPVLIGAAAAKLAIEEAGFVAELQVGIDAPRGVQPFTVYEQKPAANSDLAKGGAIAITLYAGEPPTAATAADVPATPSHSPAIAPSPAIASPAPKSSQAAPSMPLAGAR
jgi:hypothetical protein